MKTKTSFRVNHLAGLENVVRAWEVAAVADVPIHIIFAEPEKENVDTWDGSRVIQSLKHIRDVNPIPNALMCIEAPRPRSENVFSRYQPEPVEDIKARIDTARDFLDGIPEDIDSASESMLKTAYQRLCLSPVHVESILHVARACAALDGSDRIRPDHVAEAIQYHATSR